MSSIVPFGFRCLVVGSEIFLHFIFFTFLYIFTFSQQQVSMIFKEQIEC